MLEHGVGVLLPPSMCVYFLASTDDRTTGNQTDFFRTLSPVTTKSSVPRPIETIVSFTNLYYRFCGPVLQVASPRWRRYRYRDVSDEIKNRGQKSRYPHTGRIPYTDRHLYTYTYTK